MSSVSIPRFGRVKWFNARNNYGFIVDLHDGEELFVHTSDLRPKNTDPNFPKTLYTGEYVEFDVCPSHMPGREKAVNVRGMMSHEPFGGTLLCEMGQLRFTEYSRVQFENQNGPDDGTEEMKESKGIEGVEVVPSGLDCV